MASTRPGEQGCFGRGSKANKKAHQAGLKNKRRKRKKQSNSKPSADLRRDRRVHCTVRCVSGCDRSRLISYQSCLSWHKTIRRSCRRDYLASLLGSTVGQKRAPHFGYCGMTTTTTMMICASVYRTHVVKWMHVGTERPIGRLEELLQHTQLRGVSVCVLPLVAGNIIRGWKSLHQSVSRSVFCDDGSKSCYFTSPKSQYLAVMGSHSWETKMPHSRLT
jgi:hypothetical protein